MSVRPISLKDVLVSLSGQPVLRGISLDIQAGEHIGIVGPNGAGKSTFLRALAGVLPLSGGRIEFFGTASDNIPLQEKARQIAYLSQQRVLAWQLSVEDIAALGRHAWGGGAYNALGKSDRERVDQALIKAGADTFRGRAASALSGGEQARVHMARVLATGADVLMLDEPFAALDIRHQLDLMAVLEVERVAGQTIITAMHDLDLARRFCTRLVVLQAGYVVADGVPEEALSADVLRAVFSVKRNAVGGFEPEN